MPKRTRKSISTLAGREASYGYEIVAAGALFLFIGMGIDWLLGTAPWFTVGLALVGFISAGLRLFYADQYDAAYRETVGLPAKQQREVPEVLIDRAEADRGREAGDTTGISTFAEYKPRRFGDPVPASLRSTEAAGVGAEAEAEVAATSREVQA